MQALRTSTSGATPGTVQVRPIKTDVDVESAIVSFCSANGAFILESADHRSGYGRFTIMGFDPVHTVEVDEQDSDPLGSLAREVRQFSLAPELAAPEPPREIPFFGGWVGYISYESGLSVEQIEPTPARDIHLPQLRLALYDSAAVFDHALNRWYVAGVDWPGRLGIDRPPLAQRLGRLADRLTSSPAPPPINWAKRPCPAPKPNMSLDSYLDRVGQVKRYIEAGDIYQANLTQRFSTTTSATPLELYRRLRCTNPGSYAALLAWDDKAVISSSPELFLDLRNGLVTTRPIKGTRPRTGDETADAIARQELLRSEKDRAELNMIIDLLRNDLGKACAFGSVQVTDAMMLEEHPTVFHRVGSIRGQLRPGCDWYDLLRATLPGGSITGAPKIRAMQIINQLEPACRSAYCGSVGYIGVDGSLCLNVAIRTMVKDGDALHLFAGGGIVADSDPDAEYQECLAKSAGMMRSLGTARPESPLFAPGA